MEYFCHFHPTSSARWRCTKCQLHFDNACAMPLSDSSTHRPSCPICRIALNPLHSEALSRPEPSFFSGFLFSSPFILLLCVMTLLAAVSSYAPIHSTLLVILNQFAVFFVSIHYGRQMVFSKVVSFETNAVSKRFSRKRPGKHNDFSDLQASFKCTILLCLTYLLPVYFFYQIQWLGGLLLLLIASYSAPYLFFFIFNRVNTPEDIDTSKIFTFLKLHIFRLSSLNLVLFATCLTITDFIYIHISKSIALMAGSASATLCLLILFYQHAKAYRVFLREVDVSSAEAKKVPPKKTGNFMAAQANNAAEKQPQLSTEIELALKTGNYSHAVNLLENTLKQHPQSVLRRQQLYLLLSELNDLEKLSQHAELFLSWMLDRGKIREASQFIYRLRKHNPAFSLHNLPLKAELAKLFTRQKKYALVLWLAESCRKHAAPGEDLALIYLSASQVLVTHYKDLTKAEEYLLFIIKHCTACESTEAAKALLTHLQHNQQRDQQLRDK